MCSAKKYLSEELLLREGRVFWNGRICSSKNAMRCASDCEPSVADVEKGLQGPANINAKVRTQREQGLKSISITEEKF